jgi:hypothetical protein
VPIKPENLHRYPPNWMDIRLRILQRAGFKCEHEGCKARQHQVGYWNHDEWVLLPFALREAGAREGDRVACSDGSTVKVLRIVLTVAHLDHQPENCADENLRAWCQRHHLAYDAAHHQVTRARTRHANANTRDLFGEPAP